MGRRVWLGVLLALLLALAPASSGCGARQQRSGGSPASPVIGALALVALVGVVMVVGGLVSDCERQNGGHCGSAGARQGP